MGCIKLWKRVVTLIRVVNFKSVVSPELSGGADVINGVFVVGYGVFVNMYSQLVVNSTSCWV